MKRFQWLTAIILSVVALSCLALCFVWPTPWIYSRDHSQRVNRFTQIPEWRYPNGNYKPPQDISGYPPVAQFSLAYLYDSLRHPTLPSDERKPYVPVSLTVVTAPVALTAEDQRKLTIFRRISFGMPAQAVNRLIGKPANTWGTTNPGGHLLEHWDYPVGEVDIIEDRVVNVSSISNSSTEPVRQPIGKKAK